LSQLRGRNGTFYVATHNRTFRRDHFGDNLGVSIIGEHRAGMALLLSS
jgi:hypothetical protein